MARLDRLARSSGARDVGSNALKQLVEWGSLQPDNAMLDVGCGYGRVALPLTRYLSPSGRYEGFDVLPGEVLWAQKRIEARYPNFHFQLADLHNRYYGVDGEMAASEFRFPYADGVFDLTFLFSVFTHLLRPDMEHYLAEISRVLKPGGRCLISYFLLPSVPGRERSLQRFRFERDGCRIMDEARPEWEVAYEEKDIRDLYVRNGLRIDEPIRYGIGEPIRYGGQDFILATKLNPSHFPQP